VVDALVAGCLGRRPRTPSALTFARAFGDLRDPDLRAYAWERLGRLLGEGDLAAVGSVAATLVQSAGHLGCAEAGPVLEEIAARTTDPHLLDALCEAMARLGDAAAIDACAGLLLAAGDESAGSGAERAAALGGVLGGISDPEGRARAVAPLLRALAVPALTRHAAAALAALCAWEPVADPTPCSRAGAERGSLVGEEPTPCPLPGTERGSSPFWEAPEETEALPSPCRGGVVGGVLQPEPVEAIPAVTAGADLALMAGMLAAGASDALAEQPPAVEGPGPGSEPRASAATLRDLIGVIVTEVERTVAQFPPAYFRYGGEVAECTGKEQRVMSLLCEELQPAMDRIERAGESPEARALQARAWYLKARLHHALTCDPVARSGADALRQRQRWDQAKLAEGAYRKTLALLQEGPGRIRALFDFGVLLAEVERGEEAAAVFEQVVELGSGMREESGERLLAATAERYLERLLGTREPEATVEEIAVPDQSWAGAMHVARQALRGALVSAAGLAACGAFAWWAWTSAPKPMAPPQVVAQRPVGIARLEVTRESAKVRMHRTRRAPKVKTTQRGERLLAIGREARWWKVQFPNGVTGWIPTRYTREIP
jgi:hypothetical protein